MNDCCSAPNTEVQKDSFFCPICGKKGKPVNAMTIRSLKNGIGRTTLKFAMGFYVPILMTLRFITFRRWMLW